MDTSSSNPFLSEGVAEDCLNSESFRPDLESDRNSNTRISYNDISRQLLKDRFILTALELHTELLEIGRELPLLSDYFSNPGNFEKTRPPDIRSTSPPLSLQRSNSITTFDSLDWARYSDDGDRQAEERIAGLEFELRKAQDTIQSLRKALTVATERESSVTVKGQAFSGESNQSQQDTIKPHEKRALNFLVNEYLLKQDYKLTSVTFAEENENQDFENWDDVGLNIAKPPDLLHLYSDYGQHYKHHIASCDADTIVNFYAEEVETLQCTVNDYLEIAKQKDTAIDQLKQQITQLNSQIHDLSASLEETTQRCTSLLKTSKSFVTNPNHSLHVEPSNVNESSCLSPDQGERHKFSYQLVQRKIPARFLSALITLAFHVTEENRIAYEVSMIDGNSLGSVVSMLARVIPHVVPNVLLAKREELLPLILCAANLHPDAKARDSMLNILFNLIKRPDPEQRHMILTGCVMFARYNGPSRVENELLPQCWEQMSDKHPERRLLVAEACAALIPYLSKEMCSSLVLSMLQQMLYEEKVAEVRAALVKSLGVLTSFIDDQDKFSQVLSLYGRVLNDFTTPVQSAVLDMFLPSLALWAMELGRLADITDMIFTALYSCLTEPNDSNEISVVTDTFLATLRHLESLVQFHYVSLIISGPYKDQLNGADHSATQSVHASEGRYVEVSADNYPGLTSQSQLVYNPERFSYLTAAFLQHTSEEWYSTWDEYELLVYTVFTKLTQLLLSIQAKNCTVIDPLVNYVNRVCKLLGKSIVANKIVPRMTDLFKFDKLTSQHHKLYASCLLTLIIAGVKAAFTDTESVSELCQYLTQCIVSLSSVGAPMYAVHASLQNLLQKSELIDPILYMLAELVTHSSVCVKVNLALLLELSLRCLSMRPDFCSKILPAVIALARDPDRSVRTATVEPYAAILVNFTSREILDKVYAEMSALLNDPVNFTDCSMQLILLDVFKRVGPNSEPEFRDEVIIPRLALWSLENNKCADTARRRSVALSLFDTFCALSCCFVCDRIAQESFLPGLRYLLQDMRDLSLDGADVVQSLIKDTTEKHSPIHSAVSTLTPGQGQSSGQKMQKHAESAASKMSSLFMKKK